MIIPVLDGEAHVADQLAALAAQTYRGRWELVVADNGCRDGTVEIVREWSDRFPAVTIADATRKRGLNHARNAGAAAASGDFLAFCDSDDVAGPGWLAALVEAAPGADLIGGRNAWDELNDAMVVAWRPSKPMVELMKDHNYLHYAPGGNMGVWAQVAHELGWDERYTFGSSDQDFSWRAQLSGYRLVFAQDAVMQLRFRRTIRAMAKQFYRYGQSGPLLHRTFSGSGLPPPDNRAALAAWRKQARRIPDLWASRERRGHWVRTVSFRLGRLTGSVRARKLVL